MQVDDYDSEYPISSPHEETHGGEKKKPRRHMLLAWLILAAGSMLLAIAFTPRIISSIEESGVLPLLEAWQSRPAPTVNPDYRAAEVAFYFPTSGTGDLEDTTAYQKRTGSGLYHDTMEALLAGPDRNALARGAITRIPKGTRLIGLTVRYSVAYIDLSAEFLEAYDASGQGTQITSAPAYRQIVQTMRKTGLRDVVLLVDGIPLEKAIEAL